MRVFAVYAEKAEQMAAYSDRLADYLSYPQKTSGYVSRSLQGSIFSGSTPNHLGLAYAKAVTGKRQGASPTQRQGAGWPLSIKNLPPHSSSKSDQPISSCGPPQPITCLKQHPLRPGRISSLSPLSDSDLSDGQAFISQSGAGCCGLEALKSSETVEELVEQVATKRYWALGSGVSVDLYPGRSETRRAWF